MISFDFVNTTSIYFTNSFNAVDQTLEDLVQKIHDIIALSIKFTISEDTLSEARKNLHERYIRSFKKPMDLAYYSFCQKIGGFIPDATLLTLRVRQVGNKLVEKSDCPEIAFRFHLVDCPMVNAMNSDGNIMITKGLLDQLKSDDHLASVLAHEIAHSCTSDWMKKIDHVILSAFLTLFSITLSSTITYKFTHSFIKSFLALFLTGYTTFSIARSSFRQLKHHDEYQADSNSINYMMRAGYNPERLIDSLEILERMNKRSELSYHPATEDRILRIKQKIAAIPNTCLASAFEDFFEPMPLCPFE